MTTTLINSYLVKVSTEGGGDKIAKLCPRGLYTPARSKILVSFSVRKLVAIKWHPDIPYTLLALIIFKMLPDCDFSLRLGPSPLKKSYRSKNILLYYLQKVNVVQMSKT